MAGSLPDSPRMSSSCDAPGASRVGGKELLKQEEAPLGGERKGLETPPRLRG